ncbi:MAG: S8 family serine peptidase [Gemmatimonadota bacterium]|nr:S8 family serine peptidase [Gemmatimonadota bacterium]
MDTPLPTDGDRVRVIVRLTDHPSREQALARAISAPTLELRHERLVRDLRSIHETSLVAARAPLSAARAEGAFEELDRLWLVNAVVAMVDPARIGALEAHPAIARVVEDRRLALGRAAAGPDGRAVHAGRAPVEELVRIGVAEVWERGIFGQGAIVANTDTGVNGEDDTLGDRWRGRFAGSDASWYAPIALTVFPKDDDTALSNGHGTASMGVMTGGERSFGVAFESTWIAGDVFQDDEGFVSNALKTLQWLADPDGDPSTATDVPDVVSNSYGLTDVDPASNRIRCDPIFDEAIDALEAAGAIVVWSAGNEGGRGVTSPANRADSPVNAFAVGAVDGQNQVLTSSGQGPSQCGGPHATKPEVVAPGLSVTTRNRFNEFTLLTGTSFATPMVGGVFALMRSKDPRITPERAKAIVLETARDLGAAGDDNRSGHGLVDAAAAVARVDRPSEPFARLVGFRPADAPAGKLVPAQPEETLVIRPGGSHAIVPRLTNHGPAIGPSTATLSSPTPGVTVSRATVDLAAAGTGEFFGPADGDAFEIRLDPGIPPGSPVRLEMVVDGAAIGPFPLVLKAGEPIPGGFATHDRGRVRLSVNNFGGLGYYTGLHQGGFTLRGDGFRFPPDSPNWLFHASFMAGTGRERVSDDIPYGEDTQNASDWIPLFGFPIAIDQAAGGQRITTGYDDRKKIEPLGLRVRQESFAFGESGEDAFVLLQYAVANTAERPIEGARLGLFADWDLPGADGEPSEIAGWDPVHRLGFVEGPRAGQPVLGVVWLDDVSLGQITYAVLRREEVLESELGDPLADRAPERAEAPDPFGGEFSDAEKWDALASGQTNTSVGQPQDLWQVIGVGPISIEAGATDTVAVALVAGENLEALQQAAIAARDAYFRRVLGTEPPEPPAPGGELVLEQNFPNPIRLGQSTTIRFSVPDPGPAEDAVQIDLAVYDVLGRRVRELRAGGTVSGEQAVSWDGRDERGVPVPPGVYVIRLVAGGETRSVRALVIP